MRHYWRNIILSEALKKTVLLTAINIFAFISTACNALERRKRYVLYLDIIFNIAKILWEAADWIVTSVFLNKTKVRHYIENDRTLSLYNYDIFK